jgi:hypothetical protein
MAFTGDLEHLHIVDIIQLLNTTRKSGIFSVTGEKGESSRIIFSNGYIVGASHLNNKVRIGTVLVKEKAITAEDLRLALDVQKKAGKDRKPLIATLIDLGKVNREKAAKGLKKLIEMTLVELVGWNKGIFTLDSDIVSVSPECTYTLSEMEQEISLDAQMLLMDALRIYDERERDRTAGTAVTSAEELFEDVLPPEEREQPKTESVITADDLGLGDLEHLQRKMPEFVPENEIFDPTEIHRQKIRETLVDFPAEDQEKFVSFLEKYSAIRSGGGERQRKDEPAKGILFFSEDELITHSVMTICKAEDVLVFVTEGEEEFLRLIEQCMKIKVLPILVFDDPGKSEKIMTREKIVELRAHARERYPELAVIQLGLSGDYDFSLQSYLDGARAVLPKPSRGSDKAPIGDTIVFLEVFRSYASAFFEEQKLPVRGNDRIGNLNKTLRALREESDASASLTLLKSIAAIFERAIIFIVRPSEIAGDKAVGVFAEKEQGPTSVTRLKISLTKPSIFRDIIEQGTSFHGESNDDSLKRDLFDAIGAPLDPSVTLLPVRSCGKVIMLVYADFGAKEVSPVPTDFLEILAGQAGLTLENAFYRRQLAKETHL